MGGRGGEMKVEVMGRGGESSEEVRNKGKEKGGREEGGGLGNNNKLYRS